MIFYFLFRVNYRQRELLRWSLWPKYGAGELYIFESCKTNLFSNVKDFGWKIDLQLSEIGS